MSNDMLNGSFRTGEGTLVRVSTPEVAYRPPSLDINAIAFAEDDIREVEVHVMSEAETEIRDLEAELEAYYDSSYQRQDLHDKLADLHGLASKKVDAEKVAFKFHVSEVSKRIIKAQAAVDRDESIELTAREQRDNSQSEQEAAEQRHHDLFTVLGKILLACDQQVIQNADDPKTINTELLILSEKIRAIATPEDGAKISHVQRLGEQVLVAKQKAYQDKLTHQDALTNLEQSQKALSDAKTEKRELKLALKQARTTNDTASRYIEKGGRHSLREVRLTRRERVEELLQNLKGILRLEADYKRPQTAKEITSKGTVQ